MALARSARVGERGGDDRHGHRVEHRAADGLHRPRRDQPADARRHAAQQRAEPEDAQADLEDPPPADPVGGGPGHLVNGGRYRLVANMTARCTEDEKCADPENYGGDGQRGAHPDQIRDTGNQQATDRHQSEETEAENGGDAAAQRPGRAFLDDRAGEAEIHRKPDGQDAHRDCGQQKTGRARHAKHRRRHGDGVAGHELQSVFARNAEQPERAGKRADARDRHEIPHPIGTELEDIAHIKRKHHGEHGEDENRGQRDERNHGDHDAIGGDVAKTFLHSTPSLFFFFRGAGDAGRKRDECGDQRQKRESVQEKCGSCAPPRDDHARNRRSHQARTVEDRAIQRDRCCDLIASHQFRHQRGDRRHFKRDRYSEERGDYQHMPDVNSTRQHQPAEQDGQRDLHHLSGDENQPLVVPVRSRPSDHGQRECRQAGRKIHHPEQDRLVGQRTHHPCLRHHLHPGAGVRDGRADDVTAERTLAQHFQRARPKWSVLRFFHGRD